MGKLLTSLAVLALLVIGRGAAAGEAVGWITQVDRDSDRIFLDNGQIFGVSEDINIGSLTEGVRVVIYFDQIGREKIATDIDLAPQGAQSAEFPRSNEASDDCGSHRKDAHARTLSVPPGHAC